MKLYIDTVSDTGVWLWKQPETDPRQPHMIRVAALLLDTSMDHPADEFSVLVRPLPTWPAMTEEGIARHRIEEGDLRMRGLALGAVCHRIAGAIGQADQVVMQNVQFHTRVLGRAFDETQMERPPMPLPLICTMRLSALAMHSSKWVGLADSYRHYAGQALSLPSDPIERGLVMVRAIALVHAGITASGQV